MIGNIIWVSSCTNLGTYVIAIIVVMVAGVKRPSSDIPAHTSRVRDWGSSILVLELGLRFGVGAGAGLMTAT